MTDNLTPAQKGAQTRALNALNKSRATLAENKLVENAFVLRQSIIESITDESRNIDEECGYPTSLDVNNYQTIYDRNGIGTRLVRLWPEECWSVTPKVVEDSENTIKGNKDLTEFEKQLKILERGFHLNSILFRLDVLSGIGRFGIVNWY